MNFDFELILFYATLISGLLGLIDIVFFARHRRITQKKMPMIMEYARSFFPVLLAVFLIRSFLYEPFRIPSGSLKPTLDVGDFILVNKFNYGIRLPILRSKLYEIHQPQRGDIMVFRWPPNPSIYFIKRIVGLPGDHISYINKVLYVNGEKMPQIFIEDTQDRDENGQLWNVKLKEENLLGVKHAIYETPRRLSEDFHDIEVPPGMYFAMGDNRDASADSRYWGFVPDANIVGKANLIWMSWNTDHFNIRWHRIGKMIH